jgi:hypothetical protein
MTKQLLWTAPADAPFDDGRGGFALPSEFVRAA